MESNERQSEMFETKRMSKKKRKKIMTTEHKAIVAMYNATPTMVVNRTPKSQQKGISDLPLFRPLNQTEMF
jgi:hypothetical protein